MKKFGFLVCLISISVVFSGCTLPENQLDNLVEKYDQTPAATTMAEADIRQNIIGKWQIAHKYFDKNLGMDIISEEYNLVASGTWVSSATAIDSTNTTEYYFTVEGDWRISDKKLIVENAIQKTTSFNKKTETEQDHYDQVAEISVKTILDINATTLSLPGSESLIPRIYHRVVEEEKESQADDSSNSTEQEQKNQEIYEAIVSE